MSKVKAGGSVHQHAQGNRKSKCLGLKKSGGQKVFPGNIIIRQRGAKYKAGGGVGMGHDHTIFALIAGKVKFSQKLGNTLVSVVAD